MKCQYILLEFIWKQGYLKLRKKGPRVQMGSKMGHTLFLQLLVCPFMDLQQSINCVTWEKFKIQFFCQKEILPIETRI